ncbi:MAG: hypothetical protein N838_05195 [Thiohalocapsa sp. PB-PSB1]|nr:MAG: hypothetical protein N838_05195 [Thiohalocapsa sp. PB-PSB1]
MKAVLLATQVGEFSKRLAAEIGIGTKRSA